MRRGQTAVNHEAKSTVRSSAPEWSNWSGSLRFAPGIIGEPDDETALVELVRRAAADRRTVRVVGAGHSSAPLIETSDILVSLEKFQGLEWHDAQTLRASLRAGMTLEDATLVKEKIGWSNEVLSRVRTLKFDEMEYALPAAAGPECFRQVRRRVNEKHRWKTPLG